MTLCKENYFSKEASRTYMGSTQFKSFMECPAKAMAEIKGEYAFESDALIQGQYLDAHFEGNLDIFKAQHPELFKRNGDLLQKYESIVVAINMIESDKLMNYLCTGEQQKIFTGEIAGVPFKIMIDSLLPDRIVDRKYMKDFKDIWTDEGYKPWWAAHHYDWQAAIYQEIYRQNTGKKVPFELVAISKEKVPDKSWIRFSDKHLEECLDLIKLKAPEFQAMKEGIIDLPTCGKCEYCRSINKLTEPEVIE